MHAAGEADDLAFGDFLLVRADERLIGPAGPVRLGNKAFRVLVMLAEREGRLLTKDELFASVWDGMIVSESALTTVIKELRRALGDRPTEPRYIESVYGRGYRFLPPVAKADPTAPHGGAPQASAGSRKAPSPPEPIGEAPLLAVPPFDADGLDGSSHFGALLREEVLLALARFSDIRLTSEPAAQAAAPGAWSKREYQLSVRLIGGGGEARAFARIASLSSQAIVWADQIALDPGDSARSVDELVGRLAAAALPRLHDDVLRHLPQRPGGLYDRYFLARQQMRGLEDLDEAREAAAAWEALIDEAPDFTPAYPPLIRLYNTDFCYTGLGTSGPEERARAYRLAHRAVAVDPSDAHLHSVKGWCHLWAGEAALARAHLAEALERNPYNQNRLIEVATGFLLLDELDRAETLLERCRDLTALATEIPHEEIGLLRLLRGDPGGAAESLSLAGRIHPDDRVTTRPSIASELYALLAATAARAPDLPEQAEAWRSRVRECWAGSDEPTDDRLVEWSLFHNPFSRPSRREWWTGLLHTALEAEEAKPRSRGRARAETPSPGRPAAPARS